MVSGKYSSRMRFRSACFCLAALVLACLIQLSYAKVHHPFPMPLCHGFKLEEATVDQIQARLISGKLTSVQLVQCYIERINELNPHLKVVIEINPDVFEIAHQRDMERKKGKFYGPLHGIPILVKDNIATKDKLQTTAGSLGI
ncbi:amidase signature domain-containing protein [Endogone sp. FLAS-F59071]|nr:amidase signature domain-containing protein [Endogone sp. FLAS-F59071]|eukprot:RUS19063.1 amidase signature domain-containing protein [Endogone sp. FLAS-F59071]